MGEFVLSGFSDEAGKSLKGQLDAMEALKVPNVELRNVDGDSILYMEMDRVRQTRKELDKRGIGVSSLATFIGKQKIGEPFEEHLAMFRHALNVADALGARNMRIFSFYMPRGEDPASHRDEVLRRMDAILKAASGRGITICHENEKDIYGDTPERCLDLVESLGSERLKLIFDFANFVQVGAETYPEGYRLLRPYLEYIHVKDALKKNGAVVPPGQGDGKLREVFGELDKSGFSGFVSMEPHLASFAGFEKLGDRISSPLPASDEAKCFAVAVTAFRELLFEATGKRV